MDISQNNTGYFPHMPVCDKYSLLELNSDFSLPDYQPEIRRLLSTRALILPHNEYLGNGNAEIEGEISYKITYLGADGAIYCTTLSDKYGFSAPFDFNSHNVNNDETIIIPFCKSESVSARVLGPRKLNVRSKLACRVLAFSPSLYTPNLVGSHNKSTIENRIFETNCINIKRSANQSVILNDFISFDSQTDNIRIIDCSSNATVNECTANIDKINVKGDVVLKILYCNETEDSHPSYIYRKIPFSCELSCQGVNSLYECIAKGMCIDEKLDFQENGVGVEVTLLLSAIAQKNEPVKYIADAYSTEKTCECSTSTLSLSNAARCSCGNLTQNDVFSLENIKLSPSIKIIDIIGKSNFNELNTENGKLILKGSIDYQVIYFVDGEYSSCSLNTPMRYEIDSRFAQEADKAFKWCADSVISSIRTRHDGERLFIDCELNVNMFLHCENKIEILSEMIFGEYISKPCGEILLCYPDKNATVWSVAKHYGESQKSIRSKNSIPENEERVKSRYLVI